ncbi:MAG: DNA polymerase III subunit beta [Cytophagaceae bacterium]|nr:DNA polymerase III subunit beta [Cytophagaceae bacterium]MDW8456679.1 DNA polymerase III subunit beta [Cytophagaceae bacterium]
MKFVVSSTTLLKHLSTINGAITSNPVVPILENFLFEISDGMLKLYASDLQTSMSTELPVEANKKGSIAVPAKILLETLKNLPEQPVTFTIDENTYSVEISSDNGRYKLAGENATDFPKVPPFRNTHSFDISTDVLGRAITSTIFATGNDELKPAMTGVYLSMDDSSITFVATDSHRLVRFRRTDIKPGLNSIILPKKALMLLRASLPSENTVVNVEYNDSNASFSFNNVRLTCRLIDERFPDYENAIPQNNTNKLIINRLDFLNSMKRIYIFANKTTHQVRLKISGSELQISAEDLDFSNEANERLTCEYHGEDMEIGFNAKFLIEVLSHLDCTDVKLTLSAPNRAGLVMPTENNDSEDILMLVMPVMLSSYAT